jgi:hypothetical protein
MYQQPMKKCFLCLTLVMGLIFSAHPAQARGVTDRITDKTPTVAYTFSINRNETIHVVMTRISGDLIPFLGIQDAASNVLVRQTAEDTNNWQVTLDYMFTTSGSYSLVASRLDINEGKTSGDYILTVEGIPFPQERQPYDASVFTFKNPAVVLPDNVPSSTLNGKITNDTFVQYYLIDLKTYTTVEATVARVDGNLTPTVAILTLDESILDRGSGTNTDWSAKYSVFPIDSTWRVIAVSRTDFDTGTTTGSYKLTLTLKN